MRKQNDQSHLSSNASHSSINPLESTLKSKPSKSNNHESIHKKESELGDSKSRKSRNSKRKGCVHDVREYMRNSSLFVFHKDSRIRIACVSL